MQILLVVNYIVNVVKEDYSNKYLKLFNVRKINSLKPLTIFLTSRTIVI